MVHVKDVFIISSWLYIILPYGLWHLQWKLKLCARQVVEEVIMVDKHKSGISYGL